jgi:hypothetical protein
MLPQPKPRALREHFVVPPIRSREVICRFTLSVSSGLDVHRCLFCGDNYFDIPYTELTVCFT